MCDSKGVIRDDRQDINVQKREFATARDLHTLSEAIIDADVFVGLSVANVLTPVMLNSMAPNPVVFALANPEPEISYELCQVNTVRSCNGNRTQRLSESGKQCARFPLYIPRCVRQQSFRR